MKGGSRSTGRLETENDYLVLGLVRSWLDAGYREKRTMTGVVRWFRLMNFVCSSQGNSNLCANAIDW